jgi:hypothetical protein
MSGVTSNSLPCVFMVKLPAEGQKGQMVRYQGPAGEELSADGALGTFVADVLAGKIAAHRFEESHVLAGEMRVFLIFP